MIAEQHRKLLDVLLRSTKIGSMKWDKETHLAYYTKSKELKFLIDKYWSIVDNQQITCVNLTIFEKENIIDEVVACTAAPEDKDDFNLFDELYREVEKQYSANAEKTTYPIITEITSSLEKNLQANQ